MKMKLRTTSSSIRLRLSQSDVRNFADNGVVEETLNIDPSSGQYFRYGLYRDETAEYLTARFEDRCLSISVPAAAAHIWASSDKVGIEAQEASDGPTILVEKDFACLKPRSGDEDVDTFPNPEAKAAY